jgi:hypothetical protein
MENNETLAFEQLVLDIDKDLKLRESRVYRKGNWCFFCGVTDGLGTCDCALPESFRCVGQKTCGDCAAAHRLIANHVKKTLAARRVDRVSSVKAKLFFQLHEAAEKLEEGSKKPLERRLYSAFSAACPYEDEPAEFRSNVLRAFRSVRFTDFQGLAAKLRTEMEDEAKMHLARYFSSCAL